MKNVILYFSGTGNTEYISRYIQEKITGDRFSLESFDVQLVKEYDKVILGFPVYACDIPSNVKTILKQFPEVKQKKLFLFCTKGFYSGLALQRAYRILKPKGYLLQGTLSQKMPGSDGLAFLAQDSNYYKNMMAKDYKHLETVDQFVVKITTGGEKTHFLFNPLNLFGSYLMILVYPIFLKYLKHKFYSNDSCINCHLCEHICSMNNITIEEGSIIFNDHCILCMRCIHQCPQEAIQIGNKTIGKVRYKGPLNDYRLKKKS